MMKKELNMPKVSASNGIRPEIRALAVLQLGKTVTPAEINDHVGTGDYAAKYVSFLNTRYGFTITANKDGRKVVSYTMIAEPANAAELRSATPKTKVAKPKAAKVSKVLGLTKSEAKVIRAEVAAEKAEDVKAKNLAMIKKVAEKQAAAKKRKVSKSKVREFDDVTEQFGTSGEVATSFSVDRDWDSIDGTDLSKLL
jgi:hypothetical protein